VGRACEGAAKFEIEGTSLEAASRLEVVAPSKLGHLPRSSAGPRGQNGTGNAGTAH